MPFVEVIQGYLFEFYQVNGTKYYKNYNPCPVEVKEQLEKCAGELYLYGIPETTTADQIANVACLLGEMYILRFKVHFTGLSRGYAYLQYMDPNLMNLALKTLPNYFNANKLGKIRVQRSNNTSNLVVRRITDMTPKEAYNTFEELCNFQECNLRYLGKNDMTFQLVFGTNEEAVQARRLLLGYIHLFGESATIHWEVKWKKN